MPIYNAVAITDNTQTQLYIFNKRSTNTCSPEEVKKSILHQWIIDLKLNTLLVKRTTRYLNKAILDKSEE